MTLRRSVISKRGVVCNVLTTIRISVHLAVLASKVGAGYAEVVQIVPEVEYAQEEDANVLLIKHVSLADV